MATKQRSRSRRSGPSRDRSPRYVAPVLDPTWQSPYAPSAAERAAHAHAVRAFIFRRKLPQTIGVGIVVLALLAGVVVSSWLVVLGVVLGALYVWDLRRALIRFENRASTLAPALLETFASGGTTKDHLRLVTVIDRLAATFGVDAVTAFIVEDPTYNAALVPNAQGYALLVTSATMRDFELIEIEGVVAHLLARHRLGLLVRESLSAVSNLSEAARRALAGPGTTYRADEVAAAAIRYPLGIAGALRKCAHQSPVAASFFTSSAYAQGRFIWFDVWSDRRQPDLSDLDDVQLRALALEEW